MPLSHRILPDGRKVIVGGRKRPTAEFKGARFSEVVDVAALPAPPAWNWNPKNLSLNPAGQGNILANDKYGDCAWAAMGHIEDSEMAASGNPYTPVTVAQVLAAYASTGFNPATGANDNGTILSPNALSYWQTNGFFGNGTGKIVGSATLDASNEQEVKTAAWMFGNLYMGVELPQEWTQDVSGWGLAGPPIPDDGHCVCSPEGGYNSRALLVNSWGFIIPVSWAAVKQYFVSSAGGEMHVVFTEDSINKASAKSANGFDAAQLTAYLKSFAA